MNRKIYQLLADVSEHDAITNLSLRIQKILQNSKQQSLIYSSGTIFNNGLSDTIFPAREMGNLKDNDLLIYHFSIGSDATDIFRKSKAKKMIYYHNITPAKYLLPYSDGYASLLRSGREELKNLVQIADFALADSKFNALELTKLGFNHVKVLPLSMDEDHLKIKHDDSVTRQFKSDTEVFLFVGRIVPNKNIEGLIKTFYYYCNSINHNSKMIIIGSIDNLPAYYIHLKKIIKSLSLQEKVIFTGKIPIAQLLAYYKRANAFISLSEHEGFCLPLVESMYFDIPVFALNRAAVQETLGGAGVLIETLDYKSIAELIKLVLNNHILKEQICQAQRKRLHELSYENYQKRLLKELIFE